MLLSLLERNGSDQERGQDKQAPESQQEHIGLLPEQEQGNKRRQGNLEIVHDRQLDGRHPAGAVIPKEKADS